jgi:hypothetical protein
LKILQHLRLAATKFIPVALVIGSTAVAVMLGEFLVRLAVTPGDFLRATLISDPALGFRIAPHNTGHDALGFRNSRVPEHAEIVAIGDSMTYGTSAPREGSWPYQLSNLLHKQVYNMGLGGYGPLQYLFLAKHDARKLRPKLLVVGFYFGNDFMDAYFATREIPYWFSWRETDSTAGGMTQYRRTLATEPSKDFAALRDWLSRHSVLYSMIKVTLLQRVALWEQDRLTSQTTPDHEMLWIDPSNHSIRTTFTPLLRLSAMDAKLPSVREGMQITKAAFVALKTYINDQGLRLLVVLIPTKERVYCRYLKDTGTHMPGAFAKLCGVEQEDKEQLENFLAMNRLAYVDVTTALEDQVDRHAQIYLKNYDAHPAALGNGVIARVVYDAIRRQQLDK